MILSEVEYSTMLSRMVVCGHCGDVVGPARHPRRADVTIVQSGTCPAHHEESPSGWEGFDFTRLIELCRCCAAVPLRSGSRWSVWFCAACKEQVGLLNGRLGRYAVPIGRHSFHAGWVLKPEQADDPVSLHIFTNSFNSVSQATDILAQWARVAVGLNLRVGGWSSDDGVPARDYCRAVQQQVDPLSRFREMCRYLAEWGGEGAASGTDRVDEDTTAGADR